MIKENRVSKYMLYAIGEIILVVIGILIALQINNWNEHRKSSGNELNVLLSLNSDLKENLKELKGLFDVFEESNHYGQRIIAALEYEVQEPDSIRIWMDNFDRMGLFNNANTTYLKLESSSEPLISNDSLRLLVTLIYEGDFSNILRREQIHINTFWPQYKKEVNESFKVGPNNDPAGFGIELRVNTPIDYTLLRQDHSFQNALVELYNLQKYRKKSLKGSIEKLEDLISAIDREIKNKQ
jgi:hypothetical protein